MIEIKQVKTQDEVNYTFVEKLMHTAFPQEERRDTVQQREYSDNNPRFCNNIILENGNSIGMISYWTMGDFYYIEHFAIDPSLRNGGYGKRVLEMIKKQLKGPIVLEVEEPNDEMSTRRIHFYKRLEFTLHKKPYIQPPYRKGDSGLPMLLMTYGDIDIEEPNDEMSTRRIHFYKRLEFTLHKKPYIQPPYRKGDSGLPMLLMTYGDIDMESDFEKVKKTLYKEVYGQEI